MIFRKIVDGWIVGTPCVSTSIGAEGMITERTQWGGTIDDNEDSIVDSAVKLYENKAFWTQCQQNGWSIIKEKFDKTKNDEKFVQVVGQTIDNLEAIRRQNPFGEILWYAGHRYTELLSKYIEFKNKST